MGNSDLTRTKLHENAMFCIFQYLFYERYCKIEDRKKIEETIEDIMEVKFDECDPFFKAIVYETLKNRKQYIEIINTKLLRWTFDRLCLVDEAILLLFTSELLNNRCEIQVAIDMGVDLAHKYCGKDNDYKYINKVLDRIGKEEC